MATAASANLEKKRIRDLERENSRLASIVEDYKRTIEELKVDKQRNYNLMNDALKAKEREIRTLQKRLEDMSALNRGLARENEEYKLRISIEEFKASARKIGDDYVDLRKEVEKANVWSRRDAAFAMMKVNTDMKAVVKKISDVTERSLEEREKEISNRINQTRVETTKENNRRTDDSSIWALVGVGVIASVICAVAAYSK